LHPAFGLYWRSKFIAAKAFGLCQLRLLFKLLPLLGQAIGFALRVLQALIISLLQVVVAVLANMQAAVVAVGS
jgi:hypothetical protein